VGHKLLESGFAEVCQLQGGIQAWKEAGYAVERSQHAPMSLQRQVQTGTN
jgi:3-mercaptopyruvate sulfurtransferase SseA